MTVPTSNLNFCVQSVRSLYNTKFLLHFALVKEKGITFARFSLYELHPIFFIVQISSPPIRHINRYLAAFHSHLPPIL
jgi:hypothetical protein